MAKKATKKKAAKKTTKKKVAKKKTAKKKSAKRRGARHQAALKGMEDEFENPPELEKCAQAYNKVMLDKNRINKRFNGCKGALIESMIEHDRQSVRVLKEGGGERILRLTKKNEIKVETPSDDSKKKKKDK